MTMELPTIEGLFEEARERLLRVERELGDITDRLNSDWSDNRHLTGEETERRQKMKQEIKNAK